MIYLNCQIKANIIFFSCENYLFLQDAFVCVNLCVLMYIIIILKLVLVNDFNAKNRILV